MRVAQRLHSRNVQTQRISPRLLAAGAILEMSSEQLQLRIEEELTLNPALEVVWDSVCEICGRGLSNGVCLFCRQGAGGEAPRASDYEDAPLPPLLSRGSHEDDDYDPLDNVGSPLSLRQYVWLQARVALPPSDLAIAQYLTATLTDDGLLEGSLEEAAEALGVTTARVAAVISQLQSLDPPGICARSVQESVLIQVRELASASPVPDLVEPILTHHWRDLANHAYEKTARALGASVERVDEAVAFIRDNLHPYPGRLYHPRHDHPRSNPLSVVRPDVIFRRDLADYVVEVVQPCDFELRVSEAYRRLEGLARKNGSGSPEHELALEQCRRATWLLQCLSLREQTLRQIAENVAAFQRPFLDTEAEGKMKALTRSQVAEQIGKHPSTVSRAISDKFVLLPSGKLMSFGAFFLVAAGPKTVVAELLSREDPERPLTDQQICRILQVRGFQVARRTVAKYRLALRLPSSDQRGRH
jgi:RNA polymerase sigma-54 factor